MFNIESYQILRSDRGHGKGGSVALYTHNDITVKLRPDLSVDGIENLFIEMLNEEVKNIVVGIIYRPPNRSIDTFFDKFDECLDIVSQENKEIYLMGDFNINLLKTDNNNTPKLISSPTTFAFHPHINKPTIISDTSKTLIDNIFSNVCNKNANNGIMYYDISDHLPILLSLTNQLLQKNKIKTHLNSTGKKQNTILI